MLNPISVVVVSWFRVWECLHSLAPKLAEMPLVDRATLQAERWGGFRRWTREGTRVVKNPWVPVGNLLPASG
jgi:hypothetical protein